MPQMKQIFDIHAHIYPDALAERAVHAISHTFYSVPIAQDGRLGTLLSDMAWAGITTTAINSVATTAHQVESINRFIMSVYEAHPNETLPLAALHPDVPDLPAAVDRLVEEGFRGVKIHPIFQDFNMDDPKGMALFAALAGKLPVLLHCGDPQRDNTSPERILRVLRACPGLKLVCAHLGGWTSWEQSAEVLAGADIWVDTSSSLYALDPDTAVRLMRAYGTDRVLFGTDFPVFDPVEELARFDALPLTQAERRAILWENHLRLFS